MDVDFYSPLKILQNLPLNLVGGLSFLIERVRAAIALTVFAQKLLDECCVLTYALLITVVTVDEYQQMVGVHRDLRPFVVAGGRSYTPYRIAIDGQAGNIQYSSSDALIRLTLLSDAQRQRVAHKLVGIKTTNAVTILYRGTVPCPVASVVSVPRMRDGSARGPCRRPCKHVGWQQCS